MSSSDNSGIPDPANIPRNLGLICGLSFSIPIALVGMVLLWLCYLPKLRSLRARRRLRARINRGVMRNNARASTAAHSGLSEAEISKFPQRTFWRINSADAKYETDKTCMICLSDYRWSEKLVELTCEHSFHKKCVVAWLESNPRCPLCSHPLNNPATPAAAHIVDIADN